MRFRSIRVLSWPGAGTLSGLLLLSISVPLLTVSCDAFVLTCAELQNCEGGAGSGAGGQTNAPRTGGAGGEDPGPAIGGAGVGATPSSGGEGGFHDPGTGGEGATVEPGIELTVPSVVRVRQGAKVRVDVHVDRKGGFDGELTVSILGLPEGVVSELIVLEAGEEEALLEIAAKSDAEQTSRRTLAVVVRGSDGLEEESEIRLVVAGAPGSLDESFGNGGVLRSDVEYSNVTIAKDESIWVAGRDNEEGLRLYRFEREGKASWNVELEGSNWYHIVSHGERVLVRYADALGENSDSLRAFLLDGSPDASFGEMGVVSLGTGIARRGDRIAVAPDGGLFVANSAGTLRLEANGTATSGFQFFHEQDSDDDRVTALAFDSKNRILSSWRMENSLRYFVTRARPDGRFDASFGSAGTAVADLGAPSTSPDQTLQAARILVRPDGSPVLLAVSSPNTYREDIAGNELALLSFTTEGGLDTDFGDGGKVVLGSGGALDTGLSTSAGNIIAAYSLGYGRDGRLIQYDDRGVLDEGFGEDGQIYLARLLAEDEYAASLIDVVEDEWAGRLIVAFYTTQHGYLASYWL